MKKRQASLAEQETKTEKIHKSESSSHQAYVPWPPEQTNLNLCLIVWSEIQLTLNKSGERSKDGVKKRQASLAEQETETEKILTLVHYNSQVWIIFSLSLLMCLDPRTNKLELCLIVWSEIQIILNNPGKNFKIGWKKGKQAYQSETRRRRKSWL